MKLSIIIPIYNVEQYLKKCLDSVLVDNAFTGQVICVNDGSTDGSLAVLEEYTKQYPNVEIMSQPNAGLSAARNAGLDKATGDYVFFLDSDDWVLPGSIDKVLSQIDGEDVIYFNAKLFNEEKQRFGREVDIPELKRMDGQSYFMVICDKPRNLPFVCVCGGLYKRSFLIENNLYNEPGIYHEDNYFTPQVLIAAKDVSSINEYVYAYRVRKGSITAHVTEKHIKDMLFVARSLYALYEKRGDVANAFYSNICGIYITLIESGYRHSIHVRRYWQKADSRRMLRGADDVRSRKIAKLTFVHPYMAYKYMTNQVSSLLRRLINRYL